MNIKKPDDIKIVVMSPALMELYDLQGLQTGVELQPVTFYQPRECLEMLIESESNEDETPDLADDFERKMGELELRLSFFTSTCRWQ